MSSKERTISVLHVDDDEEFLEMAAAFLEREDDALEVETVADPRRAVERIEGEDGPAVDCVVVDFDMPGMTGLSLLASIRETFPDLPVILFTGKGSEEIASEAIAAGVTDYLQKGRGSEQYAVLANRIVNAVEGYRARREVERTQRRFQKLIEGSVDVTSVFDEDGRWTYVSPAVESVFGFDPDELVGESGFGNLHPEDRDEIQERFESLREEPGGQRRVQARIQAADGSWKHMDVTGTNLLDDPDVRGILLHGHDVTDRKERERALAELHETSRALMGAASREAVLERGIDAAESILDLEMASFYLEEDGVLLPAMASEQTEEFLGGLPPLEPGESLAWGVFESGEAITTGDVRRYDPVQNPDTAVRSEMILPLGDHGVFLAASTEIDAFDETDVSLAKVLVANVEAALHRAEREHRLRENEATLEALHDATREITGAGSQAAVVDALVATAEDVLGFSMVEVWRVGDDDALEPVRAPEGADVGSSSSDEGDTRQWRALRDGETRIYRDDELEEGRFGRDGSVRSAIVVPVGDYGVLSAASTAVDGFDGTDRFLADILAETTAASLDRVERETVLERLHGATRALMALDSPEAVAERIAAVTHDILGYRSSLVRLVSEDGALLRPVASTNPRLLGADGRPTFRVGEGAAGEAFERGEPLVFDVDEIEDDTDRWNAGSLLCIPIGGHGVLSIADRDPGAFDESAIQLAEILAANAETALDRIERERALERQNERLEEFAGVVSHDLRNPLNVAMTYVRELQKAGGDDRLERIDDSLDRIDAIVEDVLTLARSGRDVVDPKPVALGGLATEAWGTAGGPKAHLEIDGVPDAVLGDRGRLLSLLENLFRNAREHGGDDVTVRLGRTETGFYVEDDGPGIDPDLRDSVFESGVTTAGGGTGFGLAIVARIAEAHGWTVTATEGRDGGARFLFESVETA